MAAIVRRGALATGVAASAAAPVATPAPARHMGKLAYPLQPFSKKQIKAQRATRNLKRTWPSWNDPRLMPKFLRHAERVALELGVVDELRNFDEAAKAFPNPPAIVAATLLERGNVISRDLEAWESDFLQLKDDRREQLAKPYPDALIDQWTAGEKVMETERAEAPAKGQQQGARGKPGEKGGKGKDDAGAAGGAGAGAEAKKEGGASAGAAAPAAAAAGSRAPSSSASASSGPVGLADFYESSGSMTTSSDESKGLAIAARESSADNIGDLRSLERAYSQRLALLVRDKASGQWGLPGGERLEGEPMRQAAERSLRALFGDSTLQVWYVGNSPVGHWLRVYSPEEQAARGCYGEKVFFYRAEILKGRFRMPREGEAGFRSSSTFPYSDFMWLARDEMEPVLSGTHSGSGSEAAAGEPSLEGRALYKYLHQVVGLGAGEEHARAKAWQARVKAKGLTVAQATGRRAHRVQQAKLAGLRLPAIATRDMALLAAQPWDKEGVKAKAWKVAADAHWSRLQAGHARSLALKKSLATPSRESQIRARLGLTAAAAGVGVGQPRQVAATAAAAQQLA